MRLIDADKLREDLKNKKVKMNLSDIKEAKNMALYVSNKLAVSVHETIDKQPTVNAEPVLYAKWEISCDGYYPYCTNCRYEPKVGDKLSNYCPHCGARMSDEPPKKADD